MEFADLDGYNCFTNSVLKFIQCVRIIRVHFAFSVLHRYKPQGFKSGHLAGQSLSSLSSNSLTHGAGPFLRSRQLCSYSSQSQSHIATGGQSVFLSWCRAPVGAQDQMFLLAWKLLSCPHGAPSLMRGWVCHMSVIVDSISQLAVVQLFTNLQLLINRMYNIYKASVSLGSVQQTMPYF
jgi:hypothetical protein